VAPTLSARGTDLVDETNEIRISRRIIQVIAALRLLIASAADAAEARDALRPLCVDILVLGMPAHPGDDDVLFLSKDQVHTPVSVEAPLADPMVCTSVGAHTDSASLASAMPEFLNHTIEPLLRLTTKRLDPRLTAARNRDLEP
jgi:hypothetical protein